QGQGGGHAGDGLEILEERGFKFRGPDGGICRVTQLWQRGNQFLHAQLPRSATGVGLGGGLLVAEAAIEPARARAVAAVGAGKLIDAAQAAGIGRFEIVEGVVEVEQERARTGHGRSVNADSSRANRRARSTPWMIVTGGRPSCARRVRPKSAPGRLTTSTG